MAVEIRQTIVTPDANGTESVVQLHISDAPLLDEDAAKLRIILSAKVDPRHGALLVQVQYAALRAASDALNSMVQTMAQGIKDSGREP